LVPEFINEVKAKARLFAHPQQRKGLFWTITWLHNGMNFYVKKYENYL